MGESVTNSSAKEKKPRMHFFGVFVIAALVASESYAAPVEWSRKKLRNSKSEFKNLREATAREIESAKRQADVHVHDLEKQHKEWSKLYHAMADVAREARMAARVQMDNPNEDEQADTNEDEMDAHVDEAQVDAAVDSKDLGDTRSDEAKKSSDYAEVDDNDEDEEEEDDDENAIVMDEDVDEDEDEGV